MSGDFSFQHAEPTLYAVLSGEFHPPSDPLGRAHKLAKLADAAAEKGTANEAGNILVYSPSWAPDSVTRLVLPGTSADTFQLDIDKKDGMANGFSVMKVPVGLARVAFLVVNSHRDGTEKSFPLTTNEPTEVRDYITERAQAFFSQFPAASN